MRKIKVVEVVGGHKTQMLSLKQTQKLIQKRAGEGYSIIIDGAALRQLVSIRNAIRGAKEVTIIPKVAGG